ncbi:MAG: hypothetical protein AAFS10_19610, partial [Myxococcota bacterium]
MDVIRYGTGAAVREVHFDYTLRPEPEAMLDSGLVTLQLHRLSALRALVDGHLYAHYRFEYHDQLGHDCQGNTVGATVDDRQSVLRRIVRVPRDAVQERPLSAPRPPSLQEQVLYCAEVAQQATAFGSDSAADQADKHTEMVSSIPLPTGGFDVERSYVQPITLDLNGDAANDLLMIAGQRSPPLHPTAHRTYVATPTGPSPFRAAVPGEKAYDWEQLVGRELTPAYMADLKAFDVIDLDNDGELEMLVEGTTELDWARRLTYDGSSSASVPFDDNSIGLTGCDLRVGFFADVDGDGLIDLIRRPKKAVRGVCSGPASTDWVRNTGVAPYFDTTSPKPMMVPWERSPWDPHADPRWTAHLNDVASLDSCASGVVWPVSGHYSNSANYLADQANWLDVNQDGIVDLAFSGYSCWEDMGLLEVHRWQPVLNSAFSAVYLGTGYGGFIPTEIGAGMVRLAHERRGFTYQSGHIREVVGGLRPLDVDRSGKLSVLAPDTSSGHGGYGVGGAHWRGFLKGFGFRKPLDGVVYKDPSSGSDYDYDGNYNFSYAGAPGGGTLPAERGDGPNDFLPEGLGFMGNGAHCDPRFQRLAVGDFDGDGFQDLLTFSYVGGTYTATSGGTTITGTGRS